MRRPRSSCPARCARCARRAAVQLCSDSDVAFIWGPPGTGKTVPLTHVVEELLAQDQRILLASTTNAAIDQILAKLSTRSTIHRFQGRECDVVIIDLVDAAPLRPSALVTSAPNLLNVSISRARGKLVLVADVAYFAADAADGLVATLLREAMADWLCGRGGAGRVTGPGRGRCGCRRADRAPWQ